MRYKIIVKDTRTGSVQESEFDKIDLHYRVSVHMQPIHVLGSECLEEAEGPDVIERTLSLDARESTFVQEIKSYEPKPTSEC
jgi:hypothetical protein